MRKITLVVHPQHADAIEAAEKLKRIGPTKGIDVSEHQQAGDAVIALGGDGTILRAAQVAHRLGTPLLGINLGNLGFLSTAEVADLEASFDALVAGRFEIEDRMMLEISARSGDELICELTALNEVVVERASLSRVVAIDVTVDSDRIARYTADGFIVSTPTGSTAYSLSAGGPVVEPGLQAMVLTSVSAHSPLWRSIVVAPTRKVRLVIPKDEVGLSADGRAIGTLPPGSEITVTASPDPLKIVRFEVPRFYEKLRSRFRVDPQG